MRHPLPLLTIAAVLMAPTEPPLSVVQNGLRLLLSPSGAQTVSRVDGGRTGYYYDLGEHAGELRPKARRVVMLGLGGGEMLRAARRSLPKADLVGVDINPRVVRAAVSEFRIGDFGAVGAVADGLKYVKQLRDVDVLISDMFDDDKMVGVSAEFFRDCRAALAPSGLFLINVFPMSEVPRVRAMLGNAGLAYVELREVQGSTVVFATR